MTTLYIDTCSNMHTVVSHRTGPLYIHSFIIGGLVFCTTLGQDCPLRQIETRVASDGQKLLCSNKCDQQLNSLCQYNFHGMSTPLS